VQSIQKSIFGQRTSEKIKIIYFFREKYLFLSQKIKNKKVGQIMGFVKLVSGKIF
jgi:hypothetical protein